MPPRKKKNQIETKNTKSSSSDLERLVNLSHRDPHSILGIHPVPEGVFIRVFRPEAKSISVLLGKREIQLQPIEPKGLFETLLPGEKEFPPYRVRAEYLGGNVFNIGTPTLSGPPWVNWICSFWAREITRDFMKKWERTPHVGRMSRGYLSRSGRPAEKASVWLGISTAGTVVCI